MEWLPALFALILSPVLLYAVGGRLGRGLPASLSAVAAVAMPFLAPESIGRGRAGFAVLSVVLILKIIERVRNRVHDPMMWSSPARFALWVAIPPDTRVARNAVEAAEYRGEGKKRLRGGVRRLSGFVFMLAVQIAWPQLLEFPWTFGLWSMLVAYFVVSGITEVVSGGVMHLGIHVAEVFDHPFLARGVREFWGRRWNRFVSRWLWRHVYQPVGGRDRVLLATLATFLISGLLHEYLLIACKAGTSSYTGWTTAFFVLHGLAAVGEGYLDRAGKLPRLSPLAFVGVHMLWLVATSPLFFIPLDDATGFSRWWG